MKSPKLEITRYTWTFQKYLLSDSPEADKANELAELVANRASRIAARQVKFGPPGLHLGGCLEPGVGVGLPMLRCIHNDSGTIYGIPFTELDVSQNRRVLDF